MKILVSACLLGLPCRYDGSGKAADSVLALAGRHDLVPVCPEQLGGLPTPRLPAEINEDVVMTSDGQDVTEAFERGAAMALEIACVCGCTHAVLKQRSPSCGSGQVYDGSFSGTLRGGEGVTAALLRRNGICVVDEDGTASLEG